MSMWTWWLPSKEAIDKVVETQEDEEVRDKENSAGRKAKLNRFYRRKHNRVNCIINNKRRYTNV